MFPLLWGIVEPDSSETVKMNVAPGHQGSKDLLKSEDRHANAGNGGRIDTGRTTTLVIKEIGIGAHGAP